MSFLILAVLGIVLAIAIRPKSKWRDQMPPGPKGIPILGNMLQIPPFQFLRFTEWRDQYGPIFSLNLAGKPVVVISSTKIAVDLIERRSGLYADRPRFIMANEILTDKLFLPVMKYGDPWRKLHKAAHEGLKTQVLPSYEPAQELEAVLVTQNLLKNPEQWEHELKRSTASSMKTVVYGTEPIASNDDPVISFMKGWGHRLTVAMAPGRYLVESFPSMLYLPTWLAPWKKEGLEWHEKDSRELENLIQPVREQVDNGTHKPSFGAKIYEAGDRHHLTQKEEAWLSGTMFAGGSDTTSAAFAFFVLAMRLYPDVMKKAQTELDQVVGRERVPNFSDKEKLPYVRALVKEVLRWGPFGAGIPRETQQDDYYEGYLIPKGTLVLTNGWGMDNDPEVFREPREFKPERFIDESGNDVVVPGTRNIGTVAFGFGRRICTGASLATQFMFINFATLLWALNIEPAYDEQGQVITPSPMDWIDEGTLVRPVPFRCNFVARFEGVEAVLQRDREERSS